MQEPATTASPVAAATDEAAGTHERSYRWHDPTPTARAALDPELDGLGMLRRMLDGELPPPPIADTLDFRLTSVEPGRAVFTGHPAPWQYNPIGSVHGGVLATLLDSAAGCAVHSRLAAGTAYTSLDLSVRFLRPVRVETGPFTCTGEVLNMGRSTAFVQATLVDEAGRLLAHATSTCALLRLDGAAS